MVMVYGLLAEPSNNDVRERLQRPTDRYDHHYGCYRRLGQPAQLHNNVQGTQILANICGLTS